MKRVYLDYAAATPLDENVFEAMKPLFGELFYNPSALYAGAIEVSKYLDNARESVARNIGAKPSEIVFTAGGTESDNLAIKGVMDKHPGKKVLISAVEHDAVYNAAKQYNLVSIDVDSKGKLILKKLEDSVDDDTVLISVMYANNEIGTIQPISEISKVVQKIRKSRANNAVDTPLYLHTDACQAPLYMDLNVSRLGVDLMTLNGGKIHGPKQSGILYVKAGVDLAPLIHGGGQEFGVRSGTENVANSVGFAKALEIAVKGRTSTTENVQIIRDYLIDNLLKNFDCELNGDRKNRIANNVNVIFNKADNERIIFALDDLGFDVAAGSACSASKDISSRTLLAIGRNDNQSRSSIRFSLGKQTTKQDIDKLLKALPKALKA